MCHSVIFNFSFRVKVPLPSWLCASNTRSPNRGGLSLLSRVTSPETRSSWKMEAFMYSVQKMEFWYCAIPNG